MKRIVLFALVMLSVCVVNAQWTPNDKTFTVLDKDSVYGQIQLKSIRTNDGKTILTWLRTAEGVKYNDPAFGYFLHLQVMDKDGKPLLGKEGVIVSSQPTMSYTTDYGLALAENGDILIAYWDIRDDMTERKKNRIYLYRYNQQGQSVWDKEGIAVSAKIFKNNDGRDLAPSICVNNDKIYVGFYHVENYNVKADETNWQPNPYFPDEEMPDSISVEYSDFQYLRINADGTPAWEENKNIITSAAWLAQCISDDFYLIYINETLGLSAQRVNSSGDNVWNTPTIIEPEALGDEMYVAAPTINIDSKGDVMLAYRKLMSFSGYIVMNHLSADGKTWAEAINCNNSTDGDAGNAVIATKNEKTLVAWEWKISSNQTKLHSNLIDSNGKRCWSENTDGITLEENNMWGFRVVEIIPQSNGWVIIYGNIQSWNTAKFMILKINNEGKTLWKKQIAEDEFKASGFSIVYDEQNAYIFYTCEKDLDDNGQEITGDGGLRVMCVDITDKSNDPLGIQELVHTSSTQPRIYTLDGIQNNKLNRGINIVHQVDEKGYVKTFKVMR